MRRNNYKIIPTVTVYIMIISILIVSCLPFRNISTVTVKSNRTFSTTLLYRGLFLSKDGMYSQYMLGQNWNIITAISKSIAKNLISSELFDKILYEDIPEEHELKVMPNLLELSAKTDHVTLAEMAKITYRIEIQLDIIIKPAFAPDGKPVFFRSYHIESINDTIVHPIIFAYRVINKLVERILTDIGAGDFDNPEYKSCITESIELTID